jgi:hypothetical protein
MKLFTKKRTIIGLIALVVVAAISVGAYAYWTQGGSGVGSATAGSTTDITVKQTSLTASNLYPGGPAEDLSGNFNNPNSGSVHISSITAVVDSVTGGAQDPGKPACTPADFTIGGTSGANDVPTGTGVGSWSGLNISLVDKEPSSNPANNQDNCKSATAHITYTANA